MDELNELLSAFDAEPTQKDLKCISEDQQEDERIDIPASGDTIGEAVAAIEKAYGENSMAACDNADLIVFTNEELCEKSKCGEERADVALIVKNYKWILKQAIKYAKQNPETAWDVNDLFQEGEAGLLESVDRYDSSKGANFLTYSTFWIKKYILKYINDNKSVIMIGEEAQKIISLNIEVRDEDSDRGAEIGDLEADEKTKPDEIVLNAALRKAIKAAMECSGLNSDEIKALTIKYSLDGGPVVTEKEVAEEMGKTPLAAAKLIASAMRKIGKGPMADELMDLLKQ